MAERPLSPELESESRYALFEEIAAGGMAAVHIGRLAGAVGFARTVAIKRMHPHLSRDAEFVSMFVDEANLAARIRHPNVVATLDVVRVDGELLLVMEYVHGESLSGIAQAARQRGERIPPVIATSVVSGALFGLHAAHEATDERGHALKIVHRDVTPANILVGVDGIARVLDFGIAKANVRVQSTREGQMKGKLRYMAPEQLNDQPVTRRTDVYAASMVLWELLTGERLFSASNEGAIVAKVLEGLVARPSSLMDDIPAALDAVVMKGLSRDPAARFATAREMALELERALPPAPAHAVGEWVEHTVGDALRVRADRIARIERAAEDGVTETQTPQYEVTVSHTLTVPTATPAGGPVRTRSLITSVASPAALRSTPMFANAQPPDTASAPATERRITRRLAPVANVAPEPQRTSTVRLPPVVAGWPANPANALPATEEETRRAARRRSRGLATAAVAVSAATTLLVGVIALVASSRDTSSPEAPPAGERPGPGSSSAAPSADSAAAPVLDAPGPVAADSAAAPPSPVPSSPAHAPAAHSARPAVSARPRPGCDPPYIEDANGRRRVKRECL